MMILCVVQPQNDLEKGIADILAQSGVGKKEIDHFEGLDTNKLSAEEIEQREAQVKKMKAVLFYEESKAKRRKKIKSKAYVLTLLCLSFH
jgi:U3 small nucleolar RNA-associated protein 14